MPILSAVEVSGAARSAAAVLLVSASVLAGCGGDPKPSEPSPSAAPPAQTLTVTSPDFKDGERIPDRFTCRGAGERPALAWSGDIGDAVSLAVVVDDPDAPDFTYLHWIAFDIPTTTTEIAAGPVPESVREAGNSSGAPGWTPPCPPSGEHHYRFNVYALRARTDLPAAAEANEACARIESLAVRGGTLVGVYGVE